jgi:hypothetical protein
MSFFQTYSREIVSLLVPFVGALIANIFRARAKLIWSEHNSRVMLSEEFIHVEVGPPQRRQLIIRTSSLFIQNLGRDAATDVEIVLNWKPQHLNIWPQRHYEQKENPEGRLIIQLANFAPKEFLGIDVLTVNSDMPALIQVRSAQGVATQIKTIQQPIHPKWKIGLVLYLMFMGAVATVYAVITLLQILVLIP